MRHAPDALLICNEHKTIPVREAIRCLEVVSIAFDVIRLPITILVAQQRQISSSLFCNNDIVIGKNEQSAGMLQPRHKRLGCEALHHPWRLSCVWYEQRPTCRDWIAFWRRQVFRLDEKASAQLLIGIAGGIGSYGLLRGAPLLGNGHRTKSQCSRCDCTKNASHEVLPASPSHESPPDSDGSKNASTISIDSDLANLGLWSRTFLIGLLLAVVPDIGCELPVASDLLPHHEVFAHDFLRHRPLGLEAEGPDLSRRRGPEWLDVEGCEFRVADLRRHAFPQCLDRGSALHHAGTRWKCGGVFGVERCDAGEITPVEEIYPLRVPRLNFGLLGERRRNERGYQDNHRAMLRMTHGS